MSGQWQYNGNYCKAYIHLSKRLYIFSRAGKFIGKIGMPGHGPGEYNMIYNVAFNDRTERAYIIDLQSRYIFVYDYDNNFIKQISVNRQNSIINEIKVFDDTTLLVSRFEDMMKFHDYGQFQLISIGTGEVINLTNRYKTPCPTIGRVLLEGPIKISNSDNGYLLFGYSSDTIFYYSKEKKLYPKYVLHPTTKEDQENQVYILEAHENEKYLFIDYCRQDIIATSAAFFLDKKTGKTEQFMYTDQNISVGDTQPVRFYPTPTDVPNLYFKSYSAVSLCNLYQENRLSGELKEIAETLKEDDNPVILLATLKD